MAGSKHIFSADEPWAMKNSCQVFEWYVEDRGVDQQWLAMVVLAEEDFLRSNIDEGAPLFSQYFRHTDIRSWSSCIHRS